MGLGWYVGLECLAHPFTFLCIWNGRLFRYKKKALVWFNEGENLKNPSSFLIRYGGHSAITHLYMARLL